MHITAKFPTTPNPKKVFKKERNMLVKNKKKDK